MRDVKTCGLCLILFALLGSRQGLCGEDLAARAKEGMRKAGAYWASQVAYRGGYVWEVSTDLASRRRGESEDLPVTTVWVQAGTPRVGEAFLRAYEATGDALYLDAAKEAAHCLCYGQLHSGGWTYSIEFDPERNRNWYHHLESSEKAMNDVSTFDDDNTQSAARFLMKIDHVVDDPDIDAAIQRALGCFLKAPYRDGLWDGAWPQRFPPPEGYGAYPTFNDNTMSDCVRTMVLAYQIYQKQELLDSVKRCLEFYLRSQLPDPQGAWAQQYDRDLKPAWARKFEPPSVTGSESVGNCHLLMDMFIEFGDVRYLDAVGRAVVWFQRSRIEGTEKEGIWARFYELETNRPVYFTRTYERVYTDDDLPVHYSFKGHYGVDAMTARYAALKEKGRDHFLALRAKPKTDSEWLRLAQSMEERVRTILDEQDELGRWVKTVPKKEGVRDEKGRYSTVIDENVKMEMMYTESFVKNMSVLADYLAAFQAGPPIANR